jgi:hypothetical protein
MSDGVRWAWRPQEGPQQALVVRLRSFGAPATCMPVRAIDRASRVQSRSSRVSGYAVSTAGCRVDRRPPPANRRGRSAYLPSPNSSEIGFFTTTNLPICNKLSYAVKHSFGLQ